MGAFALFVCGVSFPKDKPHRGLTREWCHFCGQFRGAFCNTLSVPQSLVKYLMCLLSWFYSLSQLTLGISPESFPDRNPRENSCSKPTLRTETNVKSEKWATGVGRCLGVTSASNWKFKGRIEAHIQKFNLRLGKKPRAFQWPY